MPEESWNEARLIPTSGISGADEQERRATSALLAVMSSVREFHRALLQPLGAPAGAMQAFIEVPFMMGDRRCYPDGLIRVSRGQRSWTALVEVKTGPSELNTEQLESYLDVARENGFQALITISNQIPAIAGLHPTLVDKRKLKRVDLYHLSWAQILTEAVMQKEHRGVADPDQAWILGELIRYLEHPRSGALQVDDMGGSWVSVREAVTAGTLRAKDKGLSDVVARFDALLRFASLQLGTEVVPVLGRKELTEPATRADTLAESLVANGTMQGSIRIPDTVNPLVVTVDLRAGRVTCHVDLDAPREGRPTTRVNWLVRQLSNAPDNIRIEAHSAHARGPGQGDLLRVIRDNPAALLGDGQRELRSFRIAFSSPIAAKRGRGRGTFIDSVLDAIDLFYGDVMQHLKAWSATPPRLREPLPDTLVPSKSALTSNALSSQDGAEPVPVAAIKDHGSETSEGLLEADMTQPFENGANLAVRPAPTESEASPGPRETAQPAAPDR